MPELTILSPHRDDAAFSLFIALSYWSRQKIKIEVRNFFTQSAYGPYAAGTQVGEVSSIRQREDRHVLREISTSIQVKDAGLLDAPIRFNVDAAVVCQQSTWSRISEEELQQLACLMKLPVAARVLAPLAIGNHVDHQAVHLAACRAIPTNKLAFYEDLPYARWTPDRVLADKVACAEAVLRVRLRPAVIRIPRATSQKRRLIRGYRSQIAPDEADAIARWSRNFRGGERVWIPRHSHGWQTLVQT